MTEQSGDRSEEGQKALEAALLVSAKDLAVSLKSARDTEGAAMLPLLQDAVDHIKTLSGHAAKIASTQPGALKKH